MEVFSSCHSAEICSKMAIDSRSNTGSCSLSQPEGEEVGDHDHIFHMSLFTRCVRC